MRDVICITEANQNLLKMLDAKKIAKKLLKEYHSLHDEADLGFLN